MVIIVIVKTPAYRAFERGLVDFEAGLFVKVSSFKCFESLYRFTLLKQVIRFCFMLLFDINAAKKRNHIKVNKSWWTVTIRAATVTKVINKCTMNNFDNQWILCVIYQAKNAKTITGSGFLNMNVIVIVWNTSKSPEMKMWLYVNMNKMYLKYKK